MYLKKLRTLIIVMFAFTSTFGFSQFTGGKGDGFSVANYRVFEPAQCDSIFTLPVEMVYFDAIKEEEFILIQWITLSERNNDYFTVEKSLDGKLWKMIGTIHGAGNSTQKTEYNLKDYNPIIGIQYYRIKQTDFDGTQVYTGVKSVSFEDKNSFSVDAYPNPSSNTLNVLISGNVNGNKSIVLSSSLGKEVYRADSFKGNKYSIDLTNLQSGVYILKVSSQLENKLMKIIKE